MRPLGRLFDVGLVEASLQCCHGITAGVIRAGTQSPSLSRAPAMSQTAHHTKPADMEPAEDARNQISPAQSDKNTATAPGNRFPGNS
jgi:hypothetical protein